MGLALAAVIGVASILTFLAQELPFWGLLVGAVVAVLIYLMHHTVALLIGSLASIVQNTKIGANVAMLIAAQDRGPTSYPSQKSATQNAYNGGKCETGKEIPHNQEKNKRTSVSQSQNQGISRWKCSFCGATNDAKYCVKCGADRNASKTREEFLKNRE